MKKFIFALLLLSVNPLVPFHVSAQPTEAEHQKNYNNCLHGYTGCDPSQLTDAERSQVQQAAHQRISETTTTACMDTRGAIHLN